MKHKNHKRGKKVQEFGKRLPNHNEIDRKKSTINWDEIRANYEQRLQWEKEQGLDPIELREQSADESKAKKRPANNPDGAPRRYDYDEIVRLYNDEKWSGTKIAKKFGAHESTIYGILRKRNVEPRPYFGAANRKEAS